MALDCLDNLVGLSDRDCECFPDQPSGWNESESGYFLTDTEGGFPLLDAIFAGANCDEGSVWDVLSKARSNAIRDFKTDLRAALATGRESEISNWRGLIGKAEKKTAHSNTKTYVGLQLSPRRLKDATFVVKALHLGLNSTKNVDITIASNKSDFADVTVTISAQAGTYVRHELAEPIVLPLYDVALTDLLYSVRYEPDGAYPLQNKLVCCGAIPGWGKHFDVGGFSRDDLEREFEYDYNFATSNFAYGLAIEGYFDCAQLDWICDLEELNGYQVLDVVARCLQFKGAMHLIASIRDSGKINKYTLLEPESMWRRYGTLKKNYENYINWLVQNLPANATSCWGCEKDAAIVVNIPA